jgi:arylsulfatase A
MKRISILVALLGWSLVGSLGAQEPVPAPNIILMVADDLGLRDLSCFGSNAVRTPNLDRMASEGIKLNCFYAACAVCSPTRASLITGRYPVRFGIRRHFNDMDSWLPESSTTVAELFRNSGYATVNVGKWHLGGLHVANGARNLYQPGPRQHGFAEYQCQIEQTPPRGQMIASKILYRQGGTALIEDDLVVGAASPYYRQHLTDSQGDYAVAAIRKHHSAGKPFFLNLWWLVPHTPYEPAPEPFWTAAATPGISDSQRRFRSMVEHMDAKIGKILTTLDELGIADNTLVVFTSDNGSAYEGNVGELSGGKGVLHEGGLRVPFIARWPNQIPAGTESSSIGHSNDVLPTLCEAAGVPVPVSANVDGLSLWPHLKGAEGPSWEQRGTVYWNMDVLGLQRYYAKPAPVADSVARTGPWKLMMNGTASVGLFDVENDPGELVNLLTERPDVAGPLTAQLLEWNQQNSVALLPMRFLTPKINATESPRIRWAPLTYPTAPGRFYVSAVPGGTVEAIPAARLGKRTVTWETTGLQSGYYRVDVLYPKHSGNSPCVHVGIKATLATTFTPSATRLNQRIGDGKPVITNQLEAASTNVTPFMGTNSSSYIWVANDVSGVVNTGRLAIQLTDSGCGTGRMVADAVKLTLISPTP